MVATFLGNGITTRLILKKYPNQQGQGAFFIAENEVK